LGTKVRKRLPPEGKQRNDANLDILADLLEAGFKLVRAQEYAFSKEAAFKLLSAPSNKRFLEIALGSAFELETQLLIIQKLGLIKAEPISQTINQLNEEQKMINGYINTLK